MGGVLVAARPTDRSPSTRAMDHLTIESRVHRVVMWTHHSTRHSMLTVRFTSESRDLDESKEPARPARSWGPKELRRSSEPQLREDAESRLGPLQRDGFRAMGWLEANV